MKAILLVFLGLISFSGVAYANCVLPRTPEDFAPGSYACAGSGDSSYLYFCAGDSWERVGPCPTTLPYSVSDSSLELGVLSAQCELYSRNYRRGTRYSVARGAKRERLPAGSAGISSLWVPSGCAVEPYKSHDCSTQRLMDYTAGGWDNLMYDHNDAFRCVRCRCD